MALKLAHEMRGICEAAAPPQFGHRHMRQSSLCQQVRCPLEAKATQAQRKTGLFGREGAVQGSHGHAELIGRPLRSEAHLVQLVLLESARALEQAPLR